MADSSAARASVSLVAFNGAKWLEACIRSVRDQDYLRIELIVIDNASTDDSVSVIDRAIANWDAARLIRLPLNVGFGAANNLAITQSAGTFVCLLNQDMVLDEAFLATCIEALDADESRGSVQGRLFRMSASGERLDVIDTTGLELHRDRRITSRDQGVAGRAVVRKEGPLFGVDGPAPVFRKSALEQAAFPSGARLEYLDEEFFLYHEDTDLAWRLQGLGWQAWYAPRAIGWHARGSSGPRGSSLLELVRYRRRLPRATRTLAWRNQRLMMIHNEDIADLRKDFAPIIRREIGSLGLMVLTPTSLIAVVSFLRHLPRAIRKRRFFRTTRRRRGGTTSVRAWLTRERT